ncbi:MAG: hypothetical protein ACPLY9_02030 [Nitrososphaerales archaeon]
MDKRLIVIVIGFLLISCSFTAPNIYAVSTPDLDKAVNYLMANYNSTIGLIPEVPNGNTYWLLSDNFLAYPVLKYYDPSNTTLTSTANNISSTLSYYMNEYGLPSINQYNILLGYTPSFNDSLTYGIVTNGYTVKIHLNNGTAILSPYQYADIAFLYALYTYRLGDVQGAINLFDIGANMYDGKGFNDLPFREGESQGVYQTYKLALYYMVGYVLARQVPNSVSERITDLQALDGGFYTGYLPNGTIPIGVTTNTETTSLVVYAYSPKIIETYFDRTLALSYGFQEESFDLSYALLYYIAPVIAIIGIFAGVVCIKRNI